MAGGQQSMGRRKKEEDWIDDEDGAIIPPGSKSVGDTSLHEPLLGQIPLSAPVRWIDCMDECPYPNPEVEFIRSPFPISLSVLAARWEGLFKIHEIEQLYACNMWSMKRSQYWDEINKQVLDTYQTEDAQFHVRLLKDDIRRFSNILDRLDGDLTQGVEYQKARGGGGFGYVKMPMTVDSIVKLSNAAVNVSNLRATRAGIATKITREEKDIGKNIKEVLDNRRATDDEAYKDLIEIAQMGGRIFDSGETESGVPIRDVTAEARVMPNGEYSVEDEELKRIRGDYGQSE
jgi:hypothetical protein